MFVILNLNDVVFFKSPVLSNSCLYLLPPGVSGLTLLRILPVSSGVFASTCRKQMPNMQAMALLQALQDEEVAKAVDGRELVLCFYAGDRHREVTMYKEAIESVETLGFHPPQRFSGGTGTLGGQSSTLGGQSGILGGQSGKNLGGGSGTLSGGSGTLGGGSGSLGKGSGTLGGGSGTLGDPTGHGYVGNHQQVSRSTGAGPSAATATRPASSQTGPSAATPASRPQEPAQAFSLRDFWEQKGKGKGRGAGLRD